MNLMFNVNITQLIWQTGCFVILNLFILMYLCDENIMINVWLEYLKKQNKNIIIL